MRTTLFKLSLLAVAMLALSMPLSAQPSIAPGGVVNASGYQTTLAPNVVFILFGANVGPSAILIAPAPGYPTSLGGTSVTFTPVGGGASVSAGIIYTVATQLAGFLPSSITPGAYEVRVTFDNQTSAAENVTVVARSFGIATSNSGGSGPAQATIGNVNGGISLVRYTSGSTSFSGLDWILTPAHGNDTLVLWGTGGGSDAANDTGGTSGDQTAAGNFMVYVDGVAIRPLYAGTSSGYPGLWQVNFTLPGDIAASCYNQVQVSANGELSNTVNIATAAAGQDACSDPSLSPAVLARLDAGGKLVGAAFGMFRSTNIAPEQIVEGTNGGIYRWTASQWAAGAPLRPALGECRVYDRIVVNGVDAANPEASLDAGAQLPLAGPGLLPGVGLVTIPGLGGGPIYMSSAATGTYTSGGAYSLTGLGGADVGPFEVSTTFPGSFTANLDSMTAVNRSQPLTINWTGTGIDFVGVIIGTGVPAGAGTRSVTISCIFPAGPGTFTVPVSVLSRLAASPATASVAVHSAVNPGTFTATLASGGSLDFGTFGPTLGFSRMLPVQ